MAAAKIEDTPVTQEIKVARTIFVPQVRTFTPHPGAVEAEQAQYFNKNRIYAFLEYFEVLAAGFCEDGVDVDWHNLGSGFQNDRGAI